MSTVSTDYHDYVFREGRLVGEFDAMYRNSRDVPWHQDQLAHSVFSDIDIAILKSIRPRSICDLGCGLGHFTSRCREEIRDADSRPPRVTGVDVSRTAIERASRQFSRVEFLVGDLLHPGFRSDQAFEVVVAKDVLWYVCQRLDRFLEMMHGLSSRWMYIAQSFPESEQWVGQDIIGSAEDIVRAMSKRGRIVHTCIERDFGRKGRVYAHVLAECEGNQEWPSAK